jgi:hypothetical protein
MDNIINWLLEDENPSVKLYTKREILGEKINDAQIKYFTNAIVNSEPVKSILSLQNPGGWWQENTYSFHPLYKNTFWQLYFLSQLGVKREVKGIDRVVKLFIKNMQTEKGSFPSTTRYSGNLLCMQGISLEMLLRLGYFNEEFTKKTIAFIGDLVYRNDYRCKYRQNLRCPWGTIKILKAFNLIPKENKNTLVESTLNKATKFILSHDIVEANYPRKNKRSSHWFLFGFPRGFQSDILEATSAVVDTGCSKNVTNLKNAFKYIMDKRLKDGTWKMEFSLNGKMLVDIEKKNKPSKWITYLALRTLIKCGYISL